MYDIITGLSGFGGKSKKKKSLQTKHPKALDSKKKVYHSCSEDCDKNKNFLWKN